MADAARNDLDQDFARFWLGDRDFLNRPVVTGLEMSTGLRKRSQPGLRTFSRTTALQVFGMVGAMLTKWNREMRAELGVS